MAKAEINVKVITITEDELKRIIRQEIAADRAARGSDVYLPRYPRPLPGYPLPNGPYWAVDPPLRPAVLCDVSVLDNTKEQHVINY